MIILSHNFSRADTQSTADTENWLGSAIRQPILQQWQCHAEPQTFMHTVRLRILNIIIIGSYPAWEEMDGCEEDIFDPRASKCVSAVFHRGLHFQLISVPSYSRNCPSTCCARSGAPNSTHLGISRVEPHHDPGTASRLSF